MKPQKYFWKLDHLHTLILSQLSIKIWLVIIRSIAENLVTCCLATPTLQWIDGKIEFLELYLIQGFSGTADSVYKYVGKFCNNLLSCLPFQRNYKSSSRPSSTDFTSSAIICSIIHCRSFYHYWIHCLSFGSLLSSFSYSFKIALLHINVPHIDPSICPLPWIWKAKGKDFPSENLTISVLLNIEYNSMEVGMANQREGTWRP